MPTDGDERPLCCGRTFLSVGQVDQARREMERTLAALAPYVMRGVPVIGLEPSCLLSFRDELPALLKGEAVDAGRTGAAAGGISRPRAEGRPVETAARAVAQEGVAARPLPPESLRRHGRGRERAEADPASLPSKPWNRAVAAWPAASAMTPTPSTSRSRWANCRCCRRCVRRPPDALIVADGTSCRHQIHDGADRDALHVARVLAMSIAAARP